MAKNYLYELIIKAGEQNFTEYFGPRLMCEVSLDDGCGFALWSGKPYFVENFVLVGGTLYHAEFSDHYLPVETMDAGSLINYSVICNYHRAKKELLSSPISGNEDILNQIMNICSYLAINPDIIENLCVSSYEAMLKNLDSPASLRPMPIDTNDFFMVDEQIYNTNLHPVKIIGGDDAVESFYDTMYDFYTLSNREDNESKNTLENWDDWNTVEGTPADMVEEDVEPTLLSDDEYKLISYLRDHADAIAIEDVLKLVKIRLRFEELELD